MVYMPFVSAFDYTLPQSAIAIHPPTERGATRLLVIERETQSLTESYYANLADFLQSGDIVVLNNTKVIKARLQAVHKNGKSIELVILEKHGSDYEHEHEFDVLYKGKLAVADTLTVGKATVVVQSIHGNGTASVSSTMPLHDLSEQHGSTPIPPYFNRESNANDGERYQTVFAKHAGSVAAPTASLNFTEILQEKLTQKGVTIETLTLHVGLGTFLPIRTENLEEHTMHSEYFDIPLQTIRAIQKAKKQGRRVVAIGTTVVRALEYNAKTILSAETKEALAGDANIFIYPGYQFQVVNAMLTNFHAPKSTVLMMAAAFAGSELLQKSYTYALENQYKFLSYGDSMLIL
jgi:S-adenosylmethionine:tRNA ribosyltransferase-isomerase